MIEFLNWWAQSGWHVAIGLFLLVTGGVLLDKWIVESLNTRRLALRLKAEVELRRLEGK